MLVSPRRAEYRTERTPARPQGPSEAGHGATVVPYDAAARFVLTGEPGRITQSVINVAPDSIFVAVSIGYGFEQERMQPLSFLSAPPPARKPDSEVKLSSFPVPVLVEGFRVHPDFQNVIFEPAGTSGVTGGIGGYSSQPISVDLLNRTFQSVQPIKDINFLFSMVDSSSGRELMDEPEHNLAGLGRSDGKRPFRPLANPLRFLPRSTVRMQVIEQTTGVNGTLFIVLYGYKILLGSSCPEPSAEWTAEAAVRGSLLNLAGERAIPFDAVAKFELTGRAGNTVEDEITVTTEGAFVVSAIGYGLAVEAEEVALNRGRTIAPGDATVDLGKLTLADFPPESLLDGIRIRQDYLRVALEAGGTLATVPLDVADQVFERLNRSDDVDFRYSIYDAGTGQAWQNSPLFNVAGLGIANGLRPFKQLTRPAIIAPRSTLRFSVEERFGRGVLFIALQGYKRMGGHEPGGRA